MSNNVELLECQYCGCTFEPENRTDLALDVERYMGECICNDCAEDKFDYCASCHSLDYISDMIYDDNCGEYVCESCYDREEFYVSYPAYDRAFFERGSKFRKIAGKDEVVTPSTRYFGAEIELDDDSESVRRTDVIRTLESAFRDREWFKYFYPKGDCSLSNGIEFMTPAMTLKAHYEHYWNEFFRVAMSTGLRGHYTEHAGLHIHINKEAFGDNPSQSDLNQAKLVLLFDVMDEELIRFSRRSLGSLEDYSNFYGVKSSFNRNFENGLSQINYYKNAGQKMRVVNFFHDDTVEVRLFKATGNPETFYAALEFCDLAVDAVTSLDLVLIKDYTFEKLMERAIQKGYTNFIKYVHRRRISGYCNDYSLNGCLSRIPR